MYNFVAQLFDRIAGPQVFYSSAYVSHDYRLSRTNRNHCQCYYRIRWAQQEKCVICIKYQAQVCFGYLLSVPPLLGIVDIGFEEIWIQSSIDLYHPSREIILVTLSMKDPANKIFSTHTEYSYIQTYRHRKIKLVGVVTAKIVRGSCIQNNFKCIAIIRETTTLRARRWCAVLYDIFFSFPVAWK